MKNNCTGRHLGSIFDDAPLEVDQMADHAVVSNRRMVHGSRVNNGSVLDAGSLADNYGSVISTKDSAGPNGTLSSNSD